MAFAGSNRTEPAIQSTGARTSNPSERRSLVRKAIAA